MLSTCTLGPDSVSAVDGTGPEPESELGLEHRVGAVSRAPQQGSGRTSNVSWNWNAAVEIELEQGSGPATGGWDQTELDRQARAVLRIMQDQQRGAGTGGVAEAGSSG